MNLYKICNSEISKMNEEITSLIHELHPHIFPIPSIGPIIVAAITAEYGNVKRFSSPDKMLSFAGLESGYYQSRTMEFQGEILKRGSFQLRCTLLNCPLPLIRFRPVFATYYHKKRQEEKTHRLSLSHVAKKSLRVIYTLEIKNIDFDESKLR